MVAELDGQSGPDLAPWQGGHCRQIKPKVEYHLATSGWSHYDLYDKPEPVSQALAKLIPFYKNHLGSSEAPSTAAAETKEPALSAR